MEVTLERTINIDIFNRSPFSFLRSWMSSSNQGTPREVQVPWQNWENWRPYPLAFPCWYILVCFLVEIKVVDRRWRRTSLVTQLKELSSHLRSDNCKRGQSSLRSRAGEIPKFFENPPSKLSNGQPGLGQCKENWFESQ